LSYDELLERLAIDCEGFSGAALAGVARAAASHALERAVDEFSEQLQKEPSSSNERPTIMDCCVTQDDFYEAINDVRNSMGTHDHTEDADEEQVENS
jgi:SpoVK/Ycf46/Vps4 family AAA+-type ATPase